MDTLEARVNDLERQVRVARRAAAGLGAALSLAIGIGAYRQAPEPQVHELLVAKEIRVVGDEGTISIGGSKPVPGSSKGDGGHDPFGITIKSKLGHEIKLGVLPMESGAACALALRDWSEPTTETQDGSVIAEACLLSPNQLAFFSTAAARGVASINFENKPQVFLRSMAKHGYGGELQLSSPNGEPRLILAADGSEDGGGLRLFNKTGEPVCAMNVDEYGNGILGVWDRKGNGRTLTPGP